MKMKIKNFLSLLILLLMVSCGPSKTTLYSDNICLYFGSEHVADADITTRIEIKDSIITFTNLTTDSVSIVKRSTLDTVLDVGDGDSIYRWNATLQNEPISFAILKDSTKNITSVGLVREESGLVFIIVPKEKVLPNKKSKNVN